jgi:hypothetical protein
VSLTDHLVIAVCCRWWPVTPFGGLGRCGYCHERPLIDGRLTLDDYRRWREENGLAVTFPGAP